MQRSLAERVHHRPCRGEWYFSAFETLSPILNHFDIDLLVSIFIPFGFDMRYHYTSLCIILSLLITLVIDKFSYSYMLKGNPVIRNDIDVHDRRISSVTFFSNHIHCSLHQRQAGPSMDTPIKKIARRMRFNRYSTPR
jgi:hypothetical protein